jgi:hypothetical protein
MRLWTIHPKYLDMKGLVALWREGLLAKKVLEDKTKGYKNHPQLDRFRNNTCLNYYLAVVFLESKKRGFKFNPNKILIGNTPKTIDVRSGQVLFECKHLSEKLLKRVGHTPLHIKYPRNLQELIHPLFKVVGNKSKEPWERG